MWKEMGIQERERKWEYRNMKGNANTGMWKKNAIFSKDDNIIPTPYYQPQEKEVKLLPLLKVPMILFMMLPSLLLQLG